MKWMYIKIPNHDNIGTNLLLQLVRCQVDFYFFNQNSKCHQDLGIKRVQTTEA